jgi:hypothetical protein
MFVTSASRPNKRRVGKPSTHLALFIMAHTKDQLLNSLKRASYGRVKVALAWIESLL